MYVSICVVLYTLCHLLVVAIFLVAFDYSSYLFFKKYFLLLFVLSQT
jgi:hypothetical protein